MANQSPDLGTWRPTSPAEAAQLFSSLTVPWWVAGGIALDLFLGSSTRQHQDLDVGVLRRDVAELLRALASWEVFAAKDGALTAMRSGEIPALGVNSLWCRPASTAPWALELLLDESDGDMWLFRRTPAIRRRLSEVIRFSAHGIPYLVPEIQLLYKAKRPRDRDRADFERTHPHLDPEAREWLLQALAIVHPGHEWMHLLSRRG